MKSFDVHLADNASDLNSTIDALDNGGTTNTSGGINMASVKLANALLFRCSEL